LSGSPKLEITKQVDQETVQQSACREGTAVLQYTIRIANRGDGLAKNLTITDMIPEELTLQSVPETYSYDKKSRELSWSLDRMEPGEEKTYTFTALAASSLEEKDEIRNIAYMDAVNYLDEAGEPKGPVPSNEVKTTVVAPHPQEEPKEDNGSGPKKKHHKSETDESTASQPQEVLLAQTGDDAPILPLIGSSILILGVIVCFLKMKKKKRE
jgi:uncharacterized repeat protein (TIGR01451 family)